MGDDTGTTTLLLGLDGFELVEAATLDHELVLTIETTARRASVVPGGAGGVEGPGDHARA